MKVFAAALAGLFALIGSVALAGAAGLAVPKDRPILEIAGSISTTNKDGAAVFDREMLESLGMETITTTTPWHKGQVTFEGVSMAKVMELVGAKGKTVKALALNDYVTQIPMEDFAKFGVILALKRDGEYMPVRDKGPLFIVYPYDSKPELKSQTYYGRSAWQLKRLEVTE
ncbi:MAG TPA: molybdopterin-dependent oxidoreductase [Microvirga sp.]|jgi:hypothetical protein|nr:molybdopterin-dependent oxidoreductase [Microvirga sp.]